MSTIDGKSAGAVRKSALITLAVLLVVLIAFFWRSFLPWTVVFSNDGPLGGLVQNQNQVPETFSGSWRDLNSIGEYGGAATPAVSTLLRTVLGPVVFSKFYASIALLVVGMGAWSFFRALKFSQTVSLLGSLAAMLNNTFFSTACWGVASQQIALGLNFFALALIVSNDATTSNFLRWSRLALAGLFVGMNVMEAADIGALYSIFIALFIVGRSFIQSEGTPLVRAGRGVGQVLLVTGFAVFIALQTIFALVGSQIKGVAGTDQDSQTKATRWSFATQWSLPKAETLSLFMPGVFGYKADTPKDIMPSFQNAYENGVYWGSIGRDPSLDQWFESGRQGPRPEMLMRLNGGGIYCGIFVWLVVGWVVAQAFRRQSFLSSEQKQMIWFWAAVVLFCLPMAWGRFAPFSRTSDDFLFYALFYKLPYFSTIRNPAKFVFLLSWAVLILFGYGIHFLSRYYFAGAASSASRRWPQGNFDRTWIRVMIGLFATTVVGWIIYKANVKNLTEYLKTVGFGGEDSTLARGIAEFSVGQAGWFVVFFGGALLLFAMILSGYFSGPRSRTAAICIGLFLFVDLGRANVPYVGHWNYKQKYDIGTLNPVVQFLAAKPHENRVAILPFRTPPQFGLFHQLYEMEWKQHHFMYYNVQCLDIVQMPRMPQDLVNFESALHSTGMPYPRRWILTNTRYLLGAAGFLDVLNEQIDPEQRRFRILQTFNIVPKPGVLNPTKLEELTVVAAGTNGTYALFEFTGALPRASLYSNWQVPAKNPELVAQLQTAELDTNTLAFLRAVGTNDFLTLQMLPDNSFNPHKTVLLSDNVTVPEPSGVGTNENAGTVEYISYSPKRIELKASAKTGSVLLLNDKFDPNWRVTVDGKPAELLRCNYIMRGVHLTAGEHTVVFSFEPDIRPLYITVAAELLAIVLIGFVIVGGRRENRTQT
jgi:hypothetical protein